MFHLQIVGLNGNFRVDDDFIDDNCCLSFPTYLRKLEKNINPVKNLYTNTKTKIQNYKQKKYIKLAVIILWLTIQDQTKRYLKKLN